jgi:uncharacterized coiled-coil protein SlyX
MNTNDVAVALVAMREQSKALAKTALKLERMGSRRDRLVKRLETLESQMADVSSGQFASKPARKAKKIKPEKESKESKPKKAKGLLGRPLSEKSLKSMLLKTLEGSEGMSVSDAVAGVQAAGYKTKAKNFRLLVNQTLLNEPGMFKRVERGVFAAK